MSSMYKTCFKDIGRKFALLRRLNIAACHPVYTVNLLSKSFQPDKAKVNFRIGPVQIITNSKLMSFLLYLNCRKTKQMFWDHTFSFHLKGYSPLLALFPLRKSKRSTSLKSSVFRYEMDSQAHPDFFFHLLTFFVLPSR